MGIPQPEEMAPEFLVAVFRDFLPQDPDHLIENQALMPNEVDLFDQQKIKINSNVQRLVPNLKRIFNSCR
jgi:hypothetical protein